MENRIGRWPRVKLLIGSQLALIFHTTITTITTTGAQRIVGLDICSIKTKDTFICESKKDEADNCFLKFPKYKCRHPLTPLNFPPETSYYSLPVNTNVLLVLQVFMTSSILDCLLFVMNYIIVNSVRVCQPVCQCLEILYLKYGCVQYCYKFNTINKSFYPHITTLPGDQLPNSSCQYIFYK